MIDRIVSVEPGVRLTAVKALSLAEEYLQDHFPRFPVMPGVLMLESLFQASAWLVRLSDDFRHSTILLKEARNVRYADFVQPGQTLVIVSEIVSQKDGLTTLKGQGFLDERVAVSGRLILESFDMVVRKPDRGPWDAYAKNELRRELAQLYRPGSLELPSRTAG